VIVIFGKNVRRNARPGVRWGIFILALAFVLAAAGCGSAEPVSQAVKDTPGDGGAAAASPFFDNSLYKGKLTVRYLTWASDDKSGDCVVIQTPDGKTMILDAGVPGFSVTLLKDLNKLGINRIDVALNTHPHSDHLGGFIAMAKQKEIGTFYAPNIPFTKNSDYNTMMSALTAKSVKPVYLQEGEHFQLGNDVKFEVLNPAKGELPGANKKFDEGELNSHSIVVMMTYKNNRFLFTGDMPADRVREVIAKYGKEGLHADFVDAPHHGITNPQELLNAVNPKVAVISQGKSKVRTKNLGIFLAKKDLQTYTTGLVGNILIVSDGSKLDVVTEKVEKN
jgi:beta-lactamase superfamily II metal-dependent hydrolase